MAAYEPTMSYRLIYIFAIHDKDHEGYLKIGDTTFDSTKSYKQLPPNCEELNQAARDRIDDYTKTDMVAYDLQYTELARKVVTFSDGEVETSLFRDKRVHEVLYRSGYTSKNFWFSDRTSEWFEVPLSVAIRAIQAVKEGRTALTAAEKSEGQTSFLPQTVPAAPKKRAKAEVIKMKAVMAMQKKIEESVAVDKFSMKRFLRKQEQHDRKRM